jgi:hypothetical protein
LINTFTDPPTILHMRLCRIVPDHCPPRDEGWRYALISCSLSSQSRLAETGSMEWGTSQPVQGEEISYSQRMVALLIDGLRYGAGTSMPNS